MKQLSYSFIRAIASVVVGILLLQHSEGVLRGLTIALGLMFLVAGIVAMIGWLNCRHKQRAAAESETAEHDDSGVVRAVLSPLPIVSLGSIILGLVLSVMLTDEFLLWSMYLLAAIFVLGALNLLVNLGTARKMETVPVWLWVVPCLVGVTAVVAMFMGLEPASSTTGVLGVTAIVYALADVAYSFYFRAVGARYEKTQAQLQRAMGQQLADETQVTVAE